MFVFQQFFANFVHFFVILNKENETHFFGQEYLFEKKNSLFLNYCFFRELRNKKLIDN